MKFVTAPGAEGAPTHDRLRGAPLGRGAVPAADLWHRDEIPYYGLDIETDTTVNGLDPTQAEIVAIALTMPYSSDGDVVLTGPEHQMLRDLDQLLQELPAGVLVTWNGAAFDLPFLAERARRQSPLEQAVDRYARAYQSIDQHRREGLPVLDMQRQEMRDAGQQLDQVRDGMKDLLRSTLQHDPATARAMTVRSTPCAVRNLACQPWSARLANTHSVRVSISAPSSRAPMALATTSRVSSTRQSE